MLKYDNGGSSLIHQCKSVRVSFLRDELTQWELRYAGGAHHTVFSQALSAEHIYDFSEMAGVEYVQIDETTDLRSLKNELRWNDAAYRLAPS